MFNPGLYKMSPYDTMKNLPFTDRQYAGDDQPTPRAFSGKIYDISKLRSFKAIFGIAFHPDILL